MTFNATILIAIDVLLSVAALLFAAVTRFGQTEVWQKLSEPQTLFVTIIFVAVLLFSSQLMESYDQRKNTRRQEIFINILYGTVTSFSLLSVLYYMVPGVMLGRGILSIALFFFALLQFCWHCIYLTGKTHPRFSQRVLVMGVDALAAKIGEMITSDAKNLQLAGYVSCHSIPQGNKPEPEQPAVPKEMILCNCENLRETAQKVQADMIVVALAERRGVFPLRDVLSCKLNSIQILDAPSIYELIYGKLMLESITPSWFIFSDGFRRTTIFNFWKRSVDIILSSVGLLITLPLFPLIALAIKLDSPGPIFFKQERVGNKEKLFVLCKLRTMRQDAEVTTGAVWAEKNDPRVTRLGRFLRGSRIDEIPQLFNVLKGDMSFIGPRPERAEFVEKLKLVIPFYSKRHFIKPGLTGWAQVRYPYGSSVEDAFEKLRYDLYYIKHTGPFLDVLIFFETIKVVLFGFGGR